MGERAVSNITGDELVAIGLGSCIGLAIADREAGVAGLSHVVLPESLEKSGPAPKFADLAVPDLVDAVVSAGAARRRLRAVTIGGACMFATSSPDKLDIGARNAQAVREALERAGIPIELQEIGGTCGRTATILVGGRISSRTAGGETRSLLSLKRGRARSLGTAGAC